MKLSDARLAELEHLIVWSHDVGGDVQDLGELAGELLAEVRSFRAALAKLNSVADSRPDPCTEHGIGDVISCGWKHAYADMVHTLRTT